MISADRFVARQSDYDRWVSARKCGISATTVANAATPSGYRQVLKEYGNPVEDNPYMRFGRESESVLMDHVHQEYGVLPSDWLISGPESWMLATPDGLSPDHSVIAECKTTGQEWGDKIPIRYLRQVQWQLHVTGAERCVFVWNERKVASGLGSVRYDQGYGSFYLAWLIPKVIIVERDDRIILNLIEVARRLRGDLGIGG